MQGTRKPLLSKALALGFTVNAKRRALRARGLQGITVLPSFIPCAYGLQLKRSESATSQSLVLQETAKLQADLGTISRKYRPRK